MPPDGVDIIFQDSEFNAAVDRLADVSARTDFEVLTGQARRLLRALVKFTRLMGRGRRQYQGTKRSWNKGRARAGWWPSWRGLRMFGIPSGTNPRVLQFDEGQFIDRRRDKDRPFVAMSNEVNYIDQLEQEDHILEQATAMREEDMARQLDRRYASNLRRFSG